MTRRPPTSPGKPAALAMAVSRGTIAHSAAASSGDAGAASPPIRAARRERFASVALLIAAIALGGVLRFSNLGRSEMSADEGASWAAASASSASRVLQLQPRLNPGKFAVHDLALHGWMRLFGDGLPAMRSLSALAGTLAIVAVFFLARELFGLSPAVIDRPAEQAWQQRAETSSLLLPAMAAVLFAVNLVFIKYAQQARMYSVAMLCGLLQVGFFIRSVRRSTASALLCTALFTALAIAATFTMALLLTPEVLWLAYLLMRRDRSIYRRAALVGLALSGGLLLLIPPAIIYLRVRAQQPSLLAYAWASPPPVWAPISMFNKASGSIAYPVMLGLVLWGLVRGWRPEREAVVFMLLWMLLPPILVLAASYLLRPAFVERYLLASFVPFFLLVALGVSSMRGFAVQCAVLALAALLALGHVYSYRRHVHDVQWREAAQAAAGGRTIVVVPPYAADVVRYYLRDSHNGCSVAPGPAKSAAVAIVAESGVSPAEVARFAAAFPRLRRRLRGVIVREH